MNIPPIPDSLLSKILYQPTREEWGKCFEEILYFIEKDGSIWLYNSRNKDLIRSCHEEKGFKEKIKLGLFVLVDLNKINKRFDNPAQEPRWG